MEKKTIVTITGIRPDFIRMSEIFKKLDENFHHILIHTGQHTDKLLSDVFFSELSIREPDFLLDTKKFGNEHYQQLGYLSMEVIELFKKENIKPDLIMFLGDSNSACVSLPLKKEGYKIGHIEAGMRSYDKRMLEEINRTVCDHCSDFLFVYHDDYKNQLMKENIINNVFVVGNTITEVLNKYVPNRPKLNDKIILDIHRPENFKYSDRLKNILIYANLCSQKYGLPVYMLKFQRTLNYMKEFNLELGNVKLIDLMPYSEYINAVYDSKFIISDSGTAQEEPALLFTPVIVPRDYTERPQSVKHNCSHMLNVNNCDNFNKSFEWLDFIENNMDKMNCEWLGNGTTAQQIIDVLKEKL